MTRVTSAHSPDDTDHIGSPKVAEPELGEPTQAIAIVAGAGATSRHVWCTTGPEGQYFQRRPAYL